MLVTLRVLRVISWRGDQKRALRLCLEEHQLFLSLLCGNTRQFKRINLQFIMSHLRVFLSSSSILLVQLEQVNCILQDILILFKGNVQTNCDIPKQEWVLNTAQDVFACLSRPVCVRSRCILCKFNMHVLGLLSVNCSIILLNDSILIHL